MPTNRRWSRILAVAGLVVMLLGAVDPLEGSLVILPGSALLAIAAWLGQSRQRKVLYWALVAVAAGVGVMWGMTAMGGIGGSTGRSMWWALLLLPYPAGWVMGLVGGVRLLRE